jgi:asparagine synthase (glutamine-hydrolysing)
MCGICGWIGAPPDTELLADMVGALAHRGPDGEGSIAGDRVSLGMRRLAIVDVAGGQQPIANEDGSVVVVFNGELYNHRALRAELQARGHHFATGSDAEVLVHLWEERREGLLDALRGMFAFALWDRRDGTVLLVATGSVSNRSTSPTCPEVVSCSPPNSAAYCATPPSVASPTPPRSTIS